MSELKKNLLISFSQKYSELVIMFVTNIIIARLLGPDEIGLYSVVAAAIVVAHMLRDFGVSQFIVKEKNLTNEKLGAAAALTGFFSACAGVILFASSDYIAIFFGRNELLEVVRVLAINFFIIPFGSVSLGLIRRDMNFSALYRINVSSAVLNAVVAINMSYLGFSYMSMVYASLAGTAITVVLALLHRPSAYRVRFFSVEQIKEVAGFGVGVSYITLIQQIFNNAPEILIGKIYGMAEAGLFSRAGGVVKIFHMGVMQGVMPVVLPHFAKKVRAGEDIVDNYFLMSVVLCSLAWPFFLFVAIRAEDIILVLYGESWLAASGYVVYLCCIGGVLVVHSLAQNVFVAIGEILYFSKMQTVIHGASLVIIALFVLVDAKYLMLSLVFCALFNVLANFYFFYKKLGVNPASKAGGYIMPALVTLGSVSPLILFDFIVKNSTLEIGPGAWRVLLSGLCFSFFWFLINFILKTPVFYAIYGAYKARRLF